MVAGKKANESKSTQKIKAQKGAWWKSTVVESEQPDVATTTAESKPPQTPEKEVPAKEPVPKAKAPRKRSPRKSKSPAADTPSQLADTATEITADSSTGVGELEGEVQKKPARKRAPRKRGPRKKKPVEPSLAEGGVEGANGDGQSTAADTHVVDQEQPDATDVEPTAIAEKSADAEVEAEKPKKKRPARKPRGRRKGTKQATETAPESSEQQDGAATVADTGEDAEAAGFESTDPDQILSETETKEAEGKENVVLKLLINAEEPEECRLALLQDGRLESIHVSTITRTQTKNNIYKGRIVAIEPNLQAAFVDYGTEKNGFLPFSEIHPEYYRQELSADIQKLVDAHHWKRLSINDVVEKGQDVMVQVVKEEVGRKGANMTTYLSLPGRSVVLMPGSDSSGISRKIVGEERRAKLRQAMNTLSIPEGIGWIVRTAGVDITKTALARDVGYLLRLWEEIKKKAQGLPGVGQVYEDHQSILRFLREHFDPALDEILVDAEEGLEQVKEFISLLPTKQRSVKVRLHKGSRPIFNQYSVEDQIESIYQPHVNLPSGGSIVIDPTEALVAIDVNSGSTSKGKNFEQSIFQANMEAASELARQLRLRDLGGLIVVDFIDMRNKKHIRDVERQVKLSMKRDKAKVDISRISKFGLMQISRQKLGAPIEAGNYRVCKHCKGRGTVRSVETLALFYLRRIQTGASRKHVKRVECRFPLDVAQYLLNKKRHEIQDHESRYDTEITIIPDPTMNPADHEILQHKAEKETNGKKQA